MGKRAVTASFGAPKSSSTLGFTSRPDQFVLEIVRMGLCHLQLACSDIRTVFLKKFIYYKAIFNLEADQSGTQLFH